jgi:outer membrane lipoprotein-sorting protein
VNASGSRRAGRERRATRGIAALSVALAFATVAAAPVDLTVAGLFARLANERPSHARFHERKYLALLTEPVDSSGELTFTPPDRLEKRTTSPKPETLTVDGAQLVIERDGRKRTLALEENPGVGVLIESIRGTLAGDLASVSRQYSVELDGDAAKWRLTLRPRDPSLRTIVERVEIGGTAAEVRSVEIFQADGDRSVMTIDSAPGR